MSASQQKFEKQFQPLSGPLQSFLSQIKQENLALPSKQEVSSKEERKPTATSTPTYSATHSSLVPRLIKYPPPPAAVQQTTPVSLDVVDVAEYEPDKDDEDEEIPIESLHETIEQLTNTQAFQEFLEQWSGLARQYIEEMITDTTNKFDHQYGVRHDFEKGKFYLGIRKLIFVIIIYFM